MELVCGERTVGTCCPVLVTSHGTSVARHQDDAATLKRKIESKEIIDDVATTLAPLGNVPAALKEVVDAVPVDDIAAATGKGCLRYGSNRGALPRAARRLVCCAGGQCERDRGDGQAGWQGGGQAAGAPRALKQDAVPLVRPGCLLGHALGMRTEKESHSQIHAWPLHNVSTSRAESGTPHATTHTARAFYHV